MKNKLIKNNNNKLKTIKMKITIMRDLIKSVFQEVNNRKKQQLKKINLMTSKKMMTKEISLWQLNHGLERLSSQQYRITKVPVNLPQFNFKYNMCMATEPKTVETTYAI